MNWNCFEAILTGILRDNIQAQVAQLDKRQHTSDNIPESNDGQRNSLVLGNAPLSETETHLYRNPILYHV